MNIYIMIAILLINIISIAIVYQFIKKMPKKEKVIFIAISIAIMYILISIIYWISGFGIDDKVHEVSKNFVLYLFVPVNVILFIPYFASQYMKLKTKNIKVQKFANKLSILLLLLLVVLIIECLYFKNIQKNIITIKETQDQNTTMNETNNNEVENKNEIINEIVSNEIESQNTNEILNNEI